MSWQKYAYIMLLLMEFTSLIINLALKQNIFDYSAGEYLNITRKNY